MTVLDDLPSVTSFLGLDLKTGSLIIATIGVLHPMAYGCTSCLAMSYLILTIWILVALYSAASVMLFGGLVNDYAILCTVWVWYTLVFTVLMILMMLLLAVAFSTRNQKERVFIVILGIMYYILTIYFIFVVNSYRKQIQIPQKILNATHQSKMISFYK